jgi:hypothetical protein
VIFEKYDPMKDYGIANRPPDAALSKVDEVERLGQWIEIMAEKIGTRDRIIGAQGRTIKQLIIWCGAVIVVLVAALAGALWGRL